MNYCIVNNHDQPIDVKHDEKGPHVKVSRCGHEVYSSLKDAKERFDYLKKYHPKMTLRIRESL